MSNTHTTEKNDPVKKYPQPPYPEQQQDIPGSDKDLRPKADHGERSYKGSGKLKGKKVVITGGDSGIGQAVAIAFAREGADILISYLNEHEDANETSKWVEEAGQKAILMPGDISEEPHCQQIVSKAVAEFGQIDVLVNNAAYQMAHHSLQEISAGELDYTFKTNIYSMFYLCKAAEPYMKPGSAVINTASVNAYKPNPVLLHYATTKGAIQNFTAELAPAYVLLASDESSYILGATIQVTGGTPTI